MKKKIAFIVHGKIKRHQQIISQIKEVFTAGYDLIFHVSQYSRHAIELSTAAVKDGAVFIIAVGGDGTLNEVANGVMNAKNDGFIDDLKWNNVKIGVLPRGTGNDFCKTIRVSYDLQLLKKLIESDSYKSIDLGLATFQDTDSNTTKHYFINITDIGLGGIIARKLSGSSKPLGAVITYQAIIISSLIGYRHKRIKVKADSFDYEGKVMSFIAANGKYFGAGLGIAPDARPDDGLFSAVIIGEISIWDYLMNLGRIRKCLKVEHPEVKYFNAREIHIESLTQPLPIDMDGEFVGYSPLKINIVPKVLKFIAPL